MKRNKVLVGLASFVICLGVSQMSAKAVTNEDKIYSSTYETINRCIDDGSQESINKARVEISNMNKYPSLRFAVGEFSRLVDKVQQNSFDNFYSYLYDSNNNSRASLEQIDVNIARNYVTDFATYKPNGPYIASWSSKVDEYQGKIIVNANDAVERCKKDPSKENIALAQKAVEELVIANNKDCSNEAMRLDKVLSDIKSETAMSLSHSLQSKSLIKKEMEEEKALVGKTLSNPTQLKIAMRGAVRNFDKVLEVKMINSDPYDVQNKIKKVLPEIQHVAYGYNGATYRIADKGKGNLEVTINFQYLYDKAKLRAERDAVYAKTNYMISKNITEGMSKYEMELRFHDYIVENSFYDSDYRTTGVYRSEEHNAFGIFIEGNGVCEGYAQAMSILCKEVGIECIYVTGYATEPHGWNMVKLDDGKWYNVDVTWDDPIYSNNDNGFIKVMHNNFNTPNDEFIKTHRADIETPVADGVKYLRDNVKITEYDAQGNEVKVISSKAQLKDMIKESILNDRLYMASRFSNFTLTSNEILDIILEVCKENNFHFKYSILYDGNPIKYFSITFTE